MPIVCDWCNLSIHRSEVFLSLTELKWGMKWNARRGDGWSKTSAYSKQDGSFIGKKGTFYGLNESSKLGFFTPKYVTIDVDLGDPRGNLENQLDSLARYSSSGETAVRPSGHFCEECFEEIAQQCFESSSRADPPFNQGGWMGFTSKHVFTGDMDQPPLMIAVCAAKLDCIDCEEEEHSLHVVYIPGNYNVSGPKQVRDGWDDDGYDWIDSGVRWRRSDLKLGRGPMVDYLRRGEWNSWIFNVFVENEQETVKTTVPCPFFDGSLTRKGWVCWDCDY